jgi:hypothetical protein
MTFEEIPMMLNVIVFAVLVTLLIAPPVTTLVHISVCVVPSRSTKVVPVSRRGSINAPTKRLVEILEDSFEIGDRLVKIWKVATASRIDCDHVPGRNHQVVKVWECRIDNGVEQIYFDVAGNCVEGLALRIFRDCIETDAFALVGDMLNDLIIWCSLA